MLMFGPELRVRLVRSLAGHVKNLGAKATLNMLRDCQHR